MILPGWTVWLKETPFDDTVEPWKYWAECDYANGGSDLYIYLSDELLEQPPADITHTLIHEMLHPHFRTLRIAYGPADDPSSDPVWYNLEEQAVETFAGLISGALGARDGSEQRPIVRTAK